MEAHVGNGILRSSTWYILLKICFSNKVGSSLREYIKLVNAIYMYRLKVLIKILIIMYFGTLNTIILTIIEKFTLKQFCEMFPLCHIYCSLGNCCRSVFWLGPLLCAPRLRTNRRCFSYVRTTDLREEVHDNLGKIRVFTQK